MATRRDYCGGSIAVSMVASMNSCKMDKYLKVYYMAESRNPQCLKELLVLEPSKLQSTVCNEFLEKEILPHEEIIHEQNILFTNMKHIPIFHVCK